MKDRKTKEKKHESTIGKIIYGFLLFLPLISILSAILIATFNEGITDINPQQVFYTAITNITTNELFTWVENSILYTGMSNFTTALGITTPFIPLLLTYWLIISVVYFLYDIVLIILVVLHRKIHYLEESI